MLRPGNKAAATDTELANPVADSQPPPYTGESTGGYDGSDGGGLAGVPRAIPLLAKKLPVRPSVRPLDPARHPKTRPPRHGVNAQVLQPLRNVRRGGVRSAEGVDVARRTRARPAMHP